jgi:hypothetical protein
MRLYRLFLLVFPAAFRAEYGEEMSAIFARRCGDASNLGSRFCVLVRAVLNVLVDAAKLHIDIITLDLRYATRSISRSPGFALTAIAISAVGIGANTAVFSVADHVLLRQLPFRDSDRLLNVWQSEPESNRSDVSPANYRDSKREASSFESLAAFRGLSVNLVGHGEPLRVDGASVTSDLLPMLGIPPLRGRFFSTDDDRSDAPGTVLLSFGL